MTLRVSSLNFEVLVDLSDSLRVMPDNHTEKDLARGKHELSLIIFPHRSYKSKLTEQSSEVVIVTSRITQTFIYVRFVKGASA